MDDLRPFTCPFASCTSVEETFDDPSSLVSHLTIHHYQGDRKRKKCPLCHEFSEKDRDFWPHLAQHLVDISLAALPLDTEAENDDLERISVTSTERNENESNADAVVPVPTQLPEPDIELLVSGIQAKTSPYDKVKRDLTNCIFITFCCLCEYVFSSNIEKIADTALLEHINSKHNVVKNGNPYSLVYRSRRDIDESIRKYADIMKYSNTEQQYYTATCCPICKASFRTRIAGLLCAKDVRERLVRHQKYNLSGCNRLRAPTHICLRCNTRFTRSEFLDKHMGICWVPLPLSYDGSNPEAPAPTVKKEPERLELYPQDHTGGETHLGFPGSLDISESFTDAKSPFWDQWVDFKGTPPPLGDLEYLGGEWATALGDMDGGDVSGAAGPRLTDSKHPTDGNDVRGI